MRTGLQMHYMGQMLYMAGNAKNPGMHAQPPKLEASATSCRVCSWGQYSQVCIHICPPAFNRGNHQLLYMKHSTTATWHIHVCVTHAACDCMCIVARIQKLCTEAQGQSWATYVLYNV